MPRPAFAAILDATGRGKHRNPLCFLACACARVCAQFCADPRMATACMWLLAAGWLRRREG